MTISTPDRSTRLWERFEQAFTSPIRYENPLQDAWLTVTFVAPSGRSVTVDGFWDGGATWRVRFMADEEGVWAYTTSCTDIGNPGLHDLYGEFLCTPPDSTWRFGSHGPVRIGENRRHFAHADGTPFFWLADTAWNGPMHATPAEWQHYLQVRLLQGFNTVQWVTMQYLGSPHGSADGEMAFSGHDRVAVNAAFFRRLDDRLDAINRAGMLAAPALLWSAHWSTDAVNALNPGLVLPEDQCILLARYQIARWGAHHVVWMLSGDANYLGENAPRWQRIGRALFGDRPHAPVTLHPCGRTWYATEFAADEWLDFIGYQSCHFSESDWMRWIVSGEPATQWESGPPRPVLNIEPNYEYHLDQSDLGRRFDALDVRRAMYWSLLASPTAGVTYGGHGVWGWDDGSRPPSSHPDSGIPLPWKQALEMEAAGQMIHLRDLFTSLAWWRLRPASALLAQQRGGRDIAHFIAAAQSDDGATALIYTPLGDPIALAQSALKSATTTWISPRTGARTSASFESGATGLLFEPPTQEDWLLLLTQERGA